MNHRIFERKLRFGAFPGARLFENHNCSHPPFVCGWHWDGFTALADSRVEWAASPEMTIGASLPFVPMFSVDFCVVSLGNRGKNLIPIEVLWRGTACQRRGANLGVRTRKVGQSTQTARLPACTPFLISNQTRLPAEFKHINKRRKRN